MQKLFLLTMCGYRNTKIFDNVQGLIHNEPPQLERLACCRFASLRGKKQSRHYFEAYICALDCFVVPPRNDARCVKGNQSF